MELLAADYAILGVAAFFAVAGLFRGFSGELGSACGWAAAAAAAYFAWPWLVGAVSAMWMRIVAAGIMALVAFFFARVLVAKTVRVMLAQPTDALLGLAVGLAKVAVAAFFAARFEEAAEFSAILREIAARVG